MGFWARLFEGLRLIGAILAYIAQLESVGATIDVPPAYLTIEGRRFRLNTRITRET